MGKKCTSIFLAIATTAASMATTARADGNAAAAFADARAAISDIAIFGRIMIDFAAASGETTAFDVDETELRNARLGLSTKALGVADITIELTTNDTGDITLTDAHLKIGLGETPVTLQIGQFKTPNSFEELSSSRFISVHERAGFTDAFQLNRRVGAAISTKGDRHTLSLGIFAQNIDDEETFGGYAIAGRATYQAPLGVENFIAHAGASFRYRALDDSEPALRFRQRPVTHIPGRILSTDRIARSDIFTGVEGVVTNGRFWLAGEYAVTIVDCDLCDRDPALSGGYVEAGLMVGGRREIGRGKFARPTVGDGPLGAVSLVFRFDTIELNGAGSNGGSYNAFVLGGDWWPRDNVRLGIDGFIVDAALGMPASGLAPIFESAILSNVREETVKGVTMRAQFDF